MQQDHQRRDQPRHQADKTVVMGKLTKAGAMLLADPIMVEHLEMLKRREVKQHHDEQHLRARELAGSLSCCLRRDQPVRFPVFEHFAEVIETAIERRDIDGHCGGSPEAALTISFWQTDAVSPAILWESPHPLSIVGVQLMPQGI